MPDEREESTVDDGPDEPAETAASSAAAPDDRASDDVDESDGGTDTPSDDTDEIAKPDGTADINQDTGDGESPADTDEGTNPTAGEGGLSYEGSPEQDGPRPEKPAADDAADETTEPGTDAAAGVSEPMPTASTGTVPGGTGTPSDDVGGISTPPDDEELPLADHIEEMISRLAIVLLVGAAGTAIGLLWATEAIDIIWAESMPQADQRPPHLYHPLELWLTRIKVASLLGVMIALPMFVYQTYRFMRPGLYPHERKYYLAAVPTSVVLAGVGMIFSYLLVLPVLFRYFTYYSEGSAAVQYSLGETFNLIITLTAFLAIVFQIPLFIMLAVMMGVTTRRWLAEKRLYFWAAFAGLAFTFTIDPTAMAAGLVAITMIVLFEGTLAMLKWTGVE